MNRFVTGELIDRVRGEYLEMPGLCLSLAQAARLCSLDQRTCAQVLDALIELRFLTLSAKGTYARVGSGREGVVFPNAVTRIIVERAAGTSTRRNPKRTQSTRSRRWWDLRRRDRVVRRRGGSGDVNLQDLVRC